MTRAGIGARRTRSNGTTSLRVWNASPAEARELAAAPWAQQIELFAPACTRCGCSNDRVCRDGCRLVGEWCVTCHRTPETAQEREQKASLMALALYRCRGGGEP